MVNRRKYRQEKVESINNYVHQVINNYWHFEKFSYNTIIACVCVCLLHTSFVITGSLRMDEIKRLFEALGIVSKGLTCCH